MYYITQTPNPSGSYSAPQTVYVEGLLVLPDEFLSVFLDYNGYVTIEHEKEKVTKIVPNVQKWNLWKKEQEENNKKYLIQQQIVELKKELESTDYKAIKFAEGWISAEEYAPIKTKRQEIRNKINELESQLGVV